MIVVIVLLWFLAFHLAPLVSFSLNSTIATFLTERITYISSSSYLIIFSLCVVLSIFVSFIAGYISVGCRHNKISFAGVFQKSSIGIACLACCLFLSVPILTSLYFVLNGSVDYNVLANSRVGSFSFLFEIRHLGYIGLLYYFRCLLIPESTQSKNFCLQRFSKMLTFKSFWIVAIVLLLYSVLLLGLGSRQLFLEVGLIGVCIILFAFGNYITVARLIALLMLISLAYVASQLLLVLRSGMDLAGLNFNFEYSYFVINFLASSVVVESGHGDFWPLIEQLKLLVPSFLRSALGLDAPQGSWQLVHEMQRIAQISGGGSLAIAQLIVIFGWTSLLFGFVLGLVFRVLEYLYFETSSVLGLLFPFLVISLVLGVRAEIGLMAKYFFQMAFLIIALWLFNIGINVLKEIRSR